MRVTVRSTPRRLVLRLVPVKLAAYWGFGAAFIIAAFWTMKAMGHATQLVCAAETRSCRLSQRTLLGGRRLSLAADQLRPARVDTTLGFVAGMQLVIVTDTGDIPLRLISANGPAKDSLARELNGFIAGPAHHGVTIRDDARLPAWLLGVVLLAAGAACILAIERTVIVFDRDANSVRIHRRRLLGAQRTDLPLDQLEGVTTESFVVQEVTSWSVVLGFGGRHGSVPLAATPLFTDASAEQTRKAIEDWLRAA